jgi:hypothetical protein
MYGGWRWHSFGSRTSYKSHMVTLMHSPIDDRWGVAFRCGSITWLDVNPSEVWGMPNDQDINPCKKCLRYAENEGRYEQISQ